MNLYFVVAGVIAAVWFLVHFFMGGREVAKPLLDSETMEPVPKFVLYYCWHLVSLAILQLSGVFLYAGLVAGPGELAILGTVIAAGFSLLGIAIPPVAKVSYLQMPQGWLFVPIVLLGVMGLI